MHYGGVALHLLHDRGEFFGGQLGVYGFLYIGAHPLHVLVPVFKIHA